MLWAPGTLTPHQSPGHLLFSFCVPLSLRILFWSLRCLFFTCGYLIGCLTVQKAFQMVGSGGSRGYRSLLGSQSGTGMSQVNDFRAHPFFSCFQEWGCSSAPIESGPTPHLLDSKKPVCAWNQQDSRLLR